MSWWRRHGVAMALLLPLVVASVWISAGDAIGTWLRAEAVDPPTGVVGQPQSVEGATMTVEGLRALPPDHEELEGYDVPEHAEVLMVDMTLEVLSDELCSLTLEGSWNDSTQEWSPLWGAGDLAYCTGLGGQAHGAVGFVVPEGVTDPVVVLTVGDAATAVALER